MKHYANKSLGLIALVFLCQPSNAATLIFAPGSEASIEIPDSWTACDLATLSLMKGGKPTGQMAINCGKFDNAGDAHMAGAPNSSIFASFVLAKNAHLSLDTLKDETPEQISAASENMCQGAFHIPPHTLPCRFDLQTVANHKAVIGHVRRPDIQQHDMLRIVAIFSRDGPVVMFSVTRPSAANDALMDKITSSIRIQPASMN